MKFCCIKFEEALKRDKQSSPNIRVVKFVSNAHAKSTAEFRLSKEITLTLHNLKTGPYRFYITWGYNNFSLDIPSFFIESSQYAA